MNSISYGGFLHRGPLMLLKVHGVPSCLRAHRLTERCGLGFPLKHISICFTEKLKNFFLYRTCMLWKPCTLMNFPVLHNTIVLIYSITFTLFYPYSVVPLGHNLYLLYLVSSCLRIYALVSIISVRGGFSMQGVN